jgi:hypothetical protein
MPPNFHLHRAVPPLKCQYINFKHEWNSFFTQLLHNDTLKKRMREISCQFRCRLLTFAILEWSRDPPDKMCRSLTMCLCMGWRSKRSHPSLDFCFSFEKKDVEYQVHRLLGEPNICLLASEVGGDALQYSVYLIARLDQRTVSDTRSNCNKRNLGCMHRLANPKMLDAVTDTEHLQLFPI